MSDAKKQSVDKCKYSHDWTVRYGEHPQPYKHIECGKCGFEPKPDSKLFHEAESIVHLRKILKPGDTVYTVLRHVSRSGMSRNIDLYFMSGELKVTPCSAKNAFICSNFQSGEPCDDPDLHETKIVCAPIWISSYVGHAIGTPQSRKNWERSQGLTVCGCGMDMGFHLVYSLGRVLWPEGFKVAGRGRNGDTSGWDKDGGYALNHKWL